MRRRGVAKVKVSGPTLPPVIAASRRRLWSVQLRRRLNFARVSEMPALAEAAAVGETSGEGRPEISRGDAVDAERRVAAAVVAGEARVLHGKGEPAGGPEFDVERGGGASFAQTSTVDTGATKRRRA